MPHVIVKMYPGSTEEVKKKLAEEITRVFMNVASKPETSVSVAIEEIAQNEWMKKVYDIDISPNLNKLYKKPGY
jgi:4-oxalocrotonate tautomerase